MDQYGLQPQASGHFTGYDINVNSGIANSVAAAALWFVASLIPKSLTVFDTVSPSFFSLLQHYLCGIEDPALNAGRF
jgi:hypothetical protein